MTVTLSVQTAIVIVGAIAAAFSVLTLSLTILTCWYRCNRRVKNSIKPISSTPTTLSLEEKASQEEVKNDSNERASSPSIMAPEQISHQPRLPKVPLETWGISEDSHGGGKTSTTQVWLVIESNSSRLGPDETLCLDSQSISTAGGCRMDAQALCSTVANESSEGVAVLAAKKRRHRTARSNSTKLLLDREEGGEEEDGEVEMVTYHPPKGLTKLESIEEDCTSEHSAIKSKISLSPKCKSGWLEEPIVNASAMTICFSPPPEAETRKNSSEHLTQYKPATKIRKAVRSNSTKPLLDDAEVKEDEVEITSEAWATIRGVIMLESADDHLKSNSNYMDALLESDC